MTNINGILNKLTPTQFMFNYLIHKIMMNIFDSLKIYSVSWEEVSERHFTQNEISCVKEAVVEPSTYGLTVKFNLVSGGYAFIPLHKDAVCGCGDIIDLSKAIIVTLKRNNETINRIKI